MTWKGRGLSGRMVEPGLWTGSFDVASRKPVERPGSIYCFAGGAVGAGTAGAEGATGVAGAFGGGAHFKLWGLRSRLAATSFAACVSTPGLFRKPRSRNQSRKRADQVPKAIPP